MQIDTSAYLTPEYCLVAGKVSPMQTHLYEHSMMYGDASPHEYRQTLVESYLNHYSKEVEAEALDEASTLSGAECLDFVFSRSLKMRKKYTN